MFFDRIGQNNFTTQADAHERKIESYLKMFYLLI